MNCYCGFCNLTVFAKDPNKVKVGEFIFHQSCFVKKRVRDFKAKREFERLERMETAVLMVKLPRVVWR